MARNYTNTASKAVTIGSTMTAAQTSVNISDGTTFPAAPYTARIEDEIVLVSAASGANSTGLTISRGFDGTTGATHGSGVGIHPVVVARDFALSPYIAFPALKPPDTPHSLDDEFDQANGTNPTTTGWSWRNQGTATAETRAGYFGMTVTGTATDSLKVLEKNAPSTPWTATAWTSLERYVPGSYKMGGLAAIDSVSGRLISCWAIVGTGTSYFAEVVKWNSVTSYSATSASYPAAGALAFAGQGLGVRIADNGTNISFHVSTDPTGVDWYQMFSEGRTTFLTNGADKIGIAGNSQPATTHVHVIKTPFFRVNWTADYDPIG